MTSFTPDQLAFIGERGHCIAVAGPGSGKTASLIEKMRRLALTPGVSVVAATFTSDAAEEMTHRLQRSMGRDPAASVSIGTWHSLALQHRKQFGLQQRTIGPGHQAKLLRRIVSARVPTHQVHTALLEFERIKCSLAAGDDAERPDWYEAYETELKTLVAIDLYDAIRDTAQRMKNGQLPLLAATHLVIDEFQDNDEIQFALADLHAAAGVVTTMVGDDDQAIYEWRRARGFAGMQEFAARHRARMLTLGDNFRSLSQIVTTSDRLIANNIGFRTQKTFIARRGSGGSVKVMATSSLASASSTIVAGLEALLQPCAETGLVRSHVPTGAVAILARNNYMLDEAEAALLEVGAKYLRSSGSIWTSEPADLLMTLLATLVTNDPRGLDVALQLGGLPDGVISKVNAAFQGRVGDFLNDGTTFTNFSPYAPALEDVARRLRSIRDKLEARQFGSAIGSAAAFVRSTYRDHTLQNVRMLSILRAVASGLIAMRGPLVARLKEATTSTANQTATNAVVLATFHASKGQEFRNVFLLGVDEDIIPGKADIRAERRLLYVACTRAQDNLVITHTSGKGSCFLQELG